MPQRRAKSLGFTLIELMIVVVIIGILAAIAIPNFMSMQNRAKEASAKSNMHTLQLTVENFSVQADGFYPGSIDTRISDLVLNGPDISVAGGARLPPFPDEAMICSHSGYYNPFNKSVNALDDLPAGPPANPVSGEVFFTAYDATGAPLADPTQPAANYKICGYGKDNVINLILTSGQ